MTSSPTGWRPLAPAGEIQEKWALLDKIRWHGRIEWQVLSSREQRLLRLLEKQGLARQAGRWVITN